MCNVLSIADLPSFGINVSGLICIHVVDRLIDELPLLSLDPLYILVKESVPDLANEH